MMIDTILYNGNIITLDDNAPRVTALAISMGRIVAAGSDDDVLNLATASTTKHNLNGKTVIPGLTDAHLHFEWLSRSLNAVDMYEIPSKAEALQRVADFAEANPDLEWITGRGWSQDLWEDGTFPTAADLDVITGNRPAYFQAKSGHAGWANSAALRLAGITADTPDPDGGTILRDANGLATGSFLETAMKLVVDAIPELTPEQLADHMQIAQNEMLKVGLTGFHDFDDPSCMAGLQVVRERGHLALRVVKQINRAWLPHALELGIRWGFGDDWIRYGALKLFADGALGPRTAYMFEPYIGEPDNYGMSLLEKEEMMELVTTASAAGLPTSIHAIGDRAVHDVLDVFEVARQQEAKRGEKPTQRRHRIEHVQIIHPSDKQRLAELDVIASMQPIHATSDWERSERFWGNERSKYAYNPRLQIDAGARVAFGSDAPVEPFRPFEGMYSAVARRQPNGTPSPKGWNPELKLTVDETLRGYTQGPAYAAGMENRLGKLAPRFLADLLVIDRDPYTTQGEELLRTEIHATMVEGKFRYGSLD
ncbi:MAG: amidohydrolase [Anaerolineae bacterium]|nr:amidohydrolase [Anaerolineae bacterium]MDQ7036291.1 amidohydrolase [Anaerolineae bacterium]